MVSVIWADGPWICCRFGEATWRMPRKRTWRHGCTLISASKTLVWDSVTAMFSRTVMHGCWRGPCRAIPPKGHCPPLCGTCSRKARRIELNGSISLGSREVRTTWSSHFESSLMESILEYSITYPEVKKALLIASHADRLPSQAEAGILALSYAESLEKSEPLINHDCDRIAWNDSAIPRNAPLVKRHRVIRAESSVITRTGKTMTSTRNDMIPTRTCEAEEE